MDRGSFAVFSQSTPYCTPVEFQYISLISHMLISNHLLHTFFLLIINLFIFKLVNNK
jgi:hypothetical protein